MALQLTPKGVRVLIPNTLDKDDQRVQAFIERNLQNLPEPPARLDHPHDQATVTDLVERWADRIGVDDKTYSDQSNAD